MKRTKSRAIRGPAAFAVSLVVAVSALSAQADDTVVCEPEAVTVITDTGPVRYTVELALTPEEQARGLMFRDSMASDHGMLFVFAEPRQANFWMKNTFIPLDILFVDDTGIVANIAERTVPFSEASLPSDGPVRAVLEIVGGGAEAAGIDAGDRVVHSAFREAPSPYHCP